MEPTPNDVVLIQTPIPPDAERSEQKLRDEMEANRAIYIYLPLFAHPCQYHPYGSIPAGRIEAIWRWQQPCIPGELPAEMTQKIVQRSQSRAAALAEASDPRDGSLVAGLMSDVIGETREMTVYFSRPGIIASGVLSSQARFGGIAIQAIRGMSLGEYEAANLNLKLFHAREVNKGIQPIPATYAHRKDHFTVFLQDRNPIVAKVAAELLQAEEVAYGAAKDHLDARDAARARGEDLRASEKDKLCLAYLNRQWATEAPLTVLQNQEVRQEELQRQMIAASQQSAEAMKELAKAVARMGAKEK